MARFTPYTRMTFCFWLRVWANIQEKVIARAIKKKSMFHTIGKTKSGGVIEGLMDLYQSPSTCWVVNKLPMNATPNEMAKAMTKTKNLSPLFFILMRISLDLLAFGFQAAFSYAWLLMEVSRTSH